MPEPSGFGLLAIYPGIVDNPPGFTFFRTGAAGIVQQFIQGSTGAPQLLFSVFTGERPPLDYVSGLGNSFYFNEGLMKFGQDVSGSPTIFGSGVLHVIWDSTDARASAGLMVTQRNSANNSGNPISSFRTNANVDGFGVSDDTYIGNRARLRTYTSSYVSKHLPNATILHCPSIYDDETFETPHGDGSVGYFNGYMWGRWDAIGSLYGNLAVYDDYTEVGHFLVSGNRQALGGKGSLVIRHAESNPTNYHRSGIALYTSGDHSLNVITSENKHIELAPGITGVNRYAHSTDIYQEISFSASNSGLITNDYDGKVLISEADSSDGNDYSIYLDGNLKDGFSCQVLTNSDIPGFFRPLGFNNIYGNDVESDAFGRQHVPKGFSRTFLSKRGDNVFINNVEETSREIYLPASQFYPSSVSGAPQAYYYNAVSDSTSQCFDFWDASLLSVETSLVIPREWSSSIRCGLVYGTTGGAVSSSTVWTIKTKNSSNGSVFSTPFANNIDLTSTITVSGRVVEAFTTGFVPFTAFTDGIGTRIHLKLTRNPLAGGDNLAANAKFLGMFVQES